MVFSLAACQHGGRPHTLDRPLQHVSCASFIREATCTSEDGDAPPPFPPVWESTRLKRPSPSEGPSSPFSGGLPRSEAGDES